jgi:ParB/RepB/Spo0J family partition protein
VAIEVKKPGRTTRGGKRANPSEGIAVRDIYDVIDSDWDLLDIPFGDISPNPFNDRDMGDLEELADDIASSGLDQPVSVMHRERFVEQYADRFPAKVDGLTTKYVLGFGERRWRASRLAGERTGAKTIRAHLRNDLVPTIRLALIRENYHRKDPTPLERARHIKTLVDDERLTYPEVCELLNIKSKGSISKLLGLLKLPEPIQAALTREEISQRTALALGDLDEHEVDAVLELIVNQDMRPDEALYQVRTAPQVVSPGNAAGGDAGHEDDPAADEVASVISSDGHVVDTDSDSDEPPNSQNVEIEDLEESRGHTERAGHSARPGAAVSKPKDSVAGDRAAAAQARERVCIDWLRREDPPTGEQREELVRRALLAGGKTDGRSRAHTWLVRSGKARFDIKDPEAYFGTVLSSGDDGLILRATWAIALAGNEVRASDRRRPNWDTHDAAYVQELMAVVGYSPATGWERSELERLGVSLGNAAEHTDQESA